MHTRKPTKKTQKTTAIIHTRQLQKYKQDNFNNTHKTTSSNIHKKTTTIHTRQLTTVHTTKLQQYTQ